mmetsp:Transcript_87560/g.245983  ORF Transcript_87560/g.245983 Transcript_87560/m.245983 type:complete len:242 (+) Transcript_87560:901-1626(+)
MALALLYIPRHRDEHHHYSGRDVNPRSQRCRHKLVRKNDLQVRSGDRLKTLDPETGLFLPRSDRGATIDLIPRSGAGSVNAVSNLLAALLSRRPVRRVEIKQHNVFESGLPDCDLGVKLLAQRPHRREHVRHRFAAHEMLGNAACGFRVVVFLRMAPRVGVPPAASQSLEEVGQKEVDFVADEFTAELNLTHAAVEQENTLGMIIRALAEVGPAVQKTPQDGSIHFLPIDLDVNAERETLL